MLASFLSVARDVGYPVLFVLVAIETMGIPVPGETALFTAGVLASSGHLKIGFVIVVSAVAAIVGDNVGFALGRRYGRQLSARFPGRSSATAARVIEVGEPFFERHGAKAVFLGPMGHRPADHVGAGWPGSTGWAWPTFLSGTPLGGICWATSIALLAYFVGRGAERFVNIAGIGGRSWSSSAGS